MNDAVLDAIRSLPVRERASLLALVKKGTPLTKEMADRVLLSIDDKIKDEDIKDELLILVASADDEEKSFVVNEEEVLKRDKEQRKPIPVKKPVRLYKIEQEEATSKETKKVEILINYASRYHSRSIKSRLQNLYDEAAKGRSEGLPHPFEEAPHIYAFHAQGGGNRKQSYRRDGKYLIDISIPQLSGGPALVIKRKGEIIKEKQRLFNQALPAFQGLLKGKPKDKETAIILNQLFPDGAPKAYKGNSPSQDVETLKKVLLSEEGGAVISHVSKSGRLKMAYYTDKKLEALINLHNSKMEVWETSEKLLFFGGEDFILENDAAKNFKLDDRYIESCLQNIDDKILRKSCIIYTPRANFKKLDFTKVEERIDWQEDAIDPSSPNRRTKQGERKKKSDIAELNKVYAGSPNFMAGVPTISARLARAILANNQLFAAEVRRIAKETKAADIESDLKRISKTSLSSALAGDATSLSAELRLCKVFSPAHIDPDFLKVVSDYKNGDANQKKRAASSLIGMEGGRFISKAPFSWILERGKPGNIKRVWHPRLVSLLQENLVSEALDRRTRYALGRLLYCQLPEIEHKLLSIAGVSEKATPPEGAKDSTPTGLRAYSDLIELLYLRQNAKTN